MSNQGEQAGRRDLNLDHDEARALHRIVRAMHDGECPNCHSVHRSDEMRKARQIGRSVRGSMPLAFDWQCPTCTFTITEDEAEEVIELFAPFMDRNLAIFEEWRANRKKRK